MPRKFQPSNPRDCIGWTVLMASSVADSSCVCSLHSPNVFAKGFLPTSCHFSLKHCSTLGSVRRNCAGGAERGERVGAADDMEVGRGEHSLRRGQGRHWMQPARLESLGAGAIDARLHPKDPRCYWSSPRHPCS